MTTMAPSVIFLMADYGHDPTETAIPWEIFDKAGFKVDFATANGTVPKCDEKMISGISGALLGADKQAKAAYANLQSRFQDGLEVLSFSDPSFSLKSYDLVFLPGGHDKGIRPLIESPRMHDLLVSYFPSTKQPSSKSLAAICHGVQVLAAASLPDGKSVMHDAETTALPSFLEQTAFQVTRLFMGDYYKTYGYGSDDVQTIVTNRLDDPSQFKNSYSVSTPQVLNHLGRRMFR